MAVLVKVLTCGSCCLLEDFLGRLILCSVVLVGFPVLSLDLPLVIEPLQRPARGGPGGATRPEKRSRRRDAEKEEEDDEEVDLLGEEGAQVGHRSQ